MACDPNEYVVIRLLNLSPFQQRPGGWRFGARRITDDVVARLIASGRARIEGDVLINCHPPGESN